MKNIFISKQFALLAVLVASAIGLVSLNVMAAPKVSYTASSWWPVNESKLSGEQPFKGVVNNLDVNKYTMQWSVDGGELNPMTTNYTDGAHKKAMVNVGNWTWNGQGPYTVAYVAKNMSGQEIARTSFSIINTDAPIPIAPIAFSEPTSTVAAQPSSTTTVKATIPTPVVSNSLSDISLYVDPYSTAQKQADAWRSSRPADALQMNKLALNPSAKWFGGWNTNLISDVSQYVSAAQAQNKVGVLVAYNVPQRDCGGYSAGGTSPDMYLSWIRNMAAGIGNKRAIVILEPDAVAHLDCLNATDQATRLSLLSQAVTILKANSATYVYIDAGNPRWQSVATMVTRLNSANIKSADGFSLNVSNFITTAENTTYGQSLSDKLGGKHFVIDTSRNGAGTTSDSQWCNPAGRALGNAPTTQTSNPLVDAYLWIKTPGESDGECNGGPSAGVWWPEYALGLAQRAQY